MSSAFRTRNDPPEILTSLKIDQLATVDRPAQEGAQAMLLKRAGVVVEADPDCPKIVMSKNGTPGVLTSDSEGHSHLLWLSGVVGESSWTKSADADSGHDHPWVMGADGAITIGASEGHTHTVDPASVTMALVAMQKSNRADGSPQEDEEMPQTDLEKLEARIAKAEEVTAQHALLAGMSDAQKAHFGGLETEADKIAFAKLDAAGRDKVISEVAKAAEGDDPILYTSKRDGTVIRESDGAALLSLTKRADEAEDRAEKAEKRARDGELQKRAETELAKLPGDAATKVALLEAIDGISDETLRGEVMKSVRAGNTAASKAFERNGSSEGGSEDGGTTVLDLAKAYQKSNPDVSLAKATAVVMKTEEGKAAYKAENGAPLQ